MNQASESKRKFASCNDEMLTSLEKFQYSKNTVRCMKTIENVFNEYLEIQYLNQIPSDKESLNEILKSFWPSLRTTKGEEYNTSSWWNVDVTGKFEIFFLKTQLREQKQS